MSYRCFVWAYVNSSASNSLFYPLIVGSLSWFILFVPELRMSYLPDLNINVKNLYGVLWVLRCFSVWGEMSQQRSCQLLTSVTSWSHQNEIRACPFHSDCQIVHFLPHFRNRFVGLWILKKIVRFKAKIDWRSLSLQIGILPRGRVFQSQK